MLDAEVVAARRRVISLRRAEWQPRPLPRHRMLRLPVRVEAVEDAAVAAEAAEFPLLLPEDAVEAVVAALEVSVEAAVRCSNPAPTWSA